MSLENIYYLSQVVAVLAILGSVIFVGIQVRQSKQQAEQANRLAEAELSMTTWGLIGNLQARWYDTEESSEFMTRAMRPNAPLSQTDKERFNARLLGALSAIELAYVLKGQNLFKESLFKRNIRNLEALFVAPGARTWWQKVGIHYFRGPFGEYVDKIVRRMEASPSFAISEAAGENLELSESAE
ncbi:MAG: hypothetical protein AAGJ84_10135 [Pseudomonadota bacterium]